VLYLFIIIIIFFLTHCFLHPLFLFFHLIATQHPPRFHHPSIYKAIKPTKPTRQHPKPTPHPPICQAIKPTRSVPQLQIHQDFNIKPTKHLQIHHDFTIKPLKSPHQTHLQSHQINAACGSRGWRCLGARDGEICGEHEMVRDREREGPDNLEREMNKLKLC
jgi:hypothetical protein